LLKVVQSAELKAPLFVAEAVGKLKVCVEVAEEIPKSVPLVPTAKRLGIGTNVYLTNSMDILALSDIGGDIPLGISGQTIGLYTNGAILRMLIGSTGETTFYNNVNATRYLTNYSYFGNGDNYNIKLNNDLSTDSGFIYQLGGSTAIASNSYYNSAGLYTATATSASSIELAGGATIFYNNSGLTSGGTFSQTERMRITSAGNVGIGTTSPSYKFQTASSVNSDWVGSFYNTSTTNPNGLQVRVGVSSSSQALGVYTDGVGYTFSVLGNGNTLIGTTTDAGYKLDVNGTARVSEMITIGSYDGLGLKMQSATSTGNTYLRFYNSAGTARGYFGLFWNGSSDYMLYDSGTLKMSFESGNLFTFNGSNVLIGTTTDAGYKLDVNGTARVSGTITNSQYHFITNTFDGRGIYADDGYGAGIFSLTREAGNEVRLQSVGSLTFFTNGANERMRIKSTGVINISNIPTSPVGLSTGDIWSNLGILTIV